MAKRYVKHTRNLTLEEKRAFKTIRYVLRNGSDVRVSFVIPGVKHNVTETSKEPEPEPAPGPTPEEVRQAEYAAMKAAFEASGLTREQWIARKKAEGVK